jgi:hypothetical protein
MNMSEVRMPRTLEDLSQAAGDLLDGGSPARALPLFGEAVAIAKAAERRRELSDLLGDMAVACRRVGRAQFRRSRYQAASPRRQQRPNVVTLSHADEDFASNRQGLGDCASLVQRPGEIQHLFDGS